MTRVRRVSTLFLYGVPVLATILLCGVVGFSFGTSALLAMVTLTALEIAFSFDNALANARVLKRMKRFWRHMFMSVGIIVAVFGARLVLPVVIVAAAAQLPVGAIADLALFEPEVYADILRSAYPLIAAFGGTFLLMIFLDYLFGRTHTARSLHAIEGVSILRNTEVLVVCGVLLLVSMPLAAMQQEVFFAGCLGAFLYIGMRQLSDFFAARHEQPTRSKVVLKHTGFFTFLYLELLDATFSLDGVVSAFALTPNVLLIAAGLGAGAIWVRAITIYFVRRPIPSYYEHLDKGVHYAIGALGMLLLVGIRVDVPDLLAESVALAIIGVACLASVWAKRHPRVAAVKSGV